MKCVEQEDRVTLRYKLASETGFTGVSILHNLYYLYKFDVLNDCVFDVMHTLLLRVVKRHLEHYMNLGFIDDLVEARLEAMPWTKGEFVCVLCTQN